MNSDIKEALRDRAYRFSVKVVKFLSALPDKKIYWTISDQLLRSSTSIGANIIEGRAASSRKEFINYYQIALKSADETMYWMDLLRDGLDVSSPELESLKIEAKELTKILAASVLKLKANKTPISSHKSQVTSHK